MYLQPIALTRDDARRAKLLQMLGNRRLRNPQAVLHMRYIAAASLPEPAHDTETHRMRDCLQKLRWLLICFPFYIHSNFHSLTFFYHYIYILRYKSSSVNVPAENFSVNSLLACARRTRGVKFL